MFIYESMRKDQIMLMVIIVAAIAVVLLLLIPQPVIKNLIIAKQSCTESGDYCIYNNIPEGLKYQKPADQLPFVYEIHEGFNRFVVQGEANLGKYEDYACAGNNKRPVIIKYFFAVCDSDLVGCNYKRSAILCGDTYFIDENMNSGPIMYGPFTLS